MNWWGSFFRALRGAVYVSPETAADVFVTGLIVLAFCTLVAVALAVSGI